MTKVNSNTYPASHRVALRVREYLNGHGCPEVGEGADPGVKKIVEEEYKDTGEALKYLVHCLAYRFTPINISLDTFGEEVSQNILAECGKDVHKAWLRALGVVRGE